MADSAGDGVNGKDLIRRQIQSILDSPGFAGSHRLSGFFRFVCEAALNGRTEVSQVEVASEVLGRAEDFNPVEDASVRKLATAVRQRLAQYYAADGQSDPVIIQLPQRSYVPVFRFRDGRAPGIGAAEQETESGPGRPPLRTVLAAVLVVVTCLFSYAGYRRAPSRAGIGRFTLVAGKGNINLGRSDAPPRCLLLGTEVRATDQVMARMVFSPLVEADQAGIMIYDDVDNYVMLGRGLSRYNHLHFAAEIHDIQGTGPTTYTTDPAGQTGAPVWLAIRRNGDEFRAFASPDGRTWRRIGEVVHAPLSRDHARLGIYAFREAINTAPPTATFDHLSIGPATASWGQDPAPLSALDGWTEVNDCRDQAAATITPDLLTITFTDDPQRCRWHLVRPAPAGDWSLRTVIDNVGWARTFAGLVVKGNRKTLYVIRNSSGGGSLVVTTNRELLFSRPDFPGNPPVVLHVFSQHGLIHVEAGTDWDNLVTLPVSYDIGELGGNVRIGLSCGRGQAQGELPLASVGFQFVGLDVLALHPYR